MPELNLDNTDERRRHLDIPLMKLDEKYTLTILYVLRNGPIQKTDLINIVASSSDTVKKRVGIRDVYREPLCAADDA